jgi:hypothetical protein
MVPLVRAVGEATRAALRSRVDGCPVPRQRQDPDPNPPVRFRQCLGSALAHTLLTQSGQWPAPLRRQPGPPPRRMRRRRRCLDNPCAATRTGEERIDARMQTKTEPRRVSRWALRPSQPLSSSIKPAGEKQRTFPASVSHRPPPNESEGGFRERPAHSHTLVPAMERGETMFTDASRIARAAPHAFEGHAMVATKQLCATIPRRVPGSCRGHRRERKEKR